MMLGDVISNLYVQRAFIFMEPFFKYVKQFGGKFGRYGELCQNDYINKYSLEAGVCYAISLGYISQCVKGIGFGSVQDRKSTWIAADGLQAIMVHSFFNSYSFQEGFLRVPPEWIRVPASIVGLRVLGGYQGISPPYAEITEFLKVNHGGVLLVIGEHACAIFKERDGRVRFFDPNYGHVTFGAWNSFVAFLSCFLHDHKIERQYRFALRKKISMYWYERA